MLENDKAKQDRRRGPVKKMKKLKKRKRWEVNGGSGGGTIERK